MELPALSAGQAVVGIKTAIVHGLGRLNPDPEFFIRLYAFDNNLYFKLISNKNTNNSILPPLQSTPPDFGICFFTKLRVCSGQFRPVCPFLENSFLGVNIYSQTGHALPAIFLLNLFFKFFGATL